jgi:hypothetical protein
MSSKRARRQLFGTVLAFAAMAASAGWINPASAPWLFAASMVYSGATAAYESRLAKRKASEAAAASAEDRKIMMRGGTVPKNYIYGSAWISGVVVFVREARGRLPPPNENVVDPWMYLVLALPIAHPITGLQALFFGDDQVQLGADGWATIQSPFAKNGSGTNTMRGVVPPSRRVTAVPAAADADVEIRVVPASVTCAITRMPQQTTGDDTWQDPAYSVYVPPSRLIYYPATGDHPGGWGNDPSTSAGNPSNDPYVEDDPFDHRNSGMQNESAPYIPPARTQTLPDEQAYLIQGSYTEIQLPGQVGEEYTLSYQYVYTKSYMHVTLYYGDGRPSPEANADLIYATSYSTAIPKWWASSTLTGIPYLIIKLRVDQDVFPRELENISVLINGKQVFDPVAGAMVWSQNPILIARDYAIAECGVEPTDIDLTSFIINRNVCDEPIPRKPGQLNRHPLGTAAAPHEPRYSFNGVLSTEVEPINNLGAILASCDGSAVFSGSTFDLRAGWFEQPTTIIEDNDWAGAPEIVVTPPRQDVINGIRARFVNSEVPYWPTDDTPAYISEYYKSLDRGVENVREIDLMGVAVSSTAQRIQKQMLHRTRSSLRIKGLLKVKGLQFSPEQTVYLNMRSTGMVLKTFRIKSLRPVALHVVEVEMQEDAAAHYQWDFKEGFANDPTPNTTLPSIRKVPPIVNPRIETSQYVATFGVGGQLQGRARVYWNAVTDTYVLNGGYVQVRHKRSSDIRWTDSARLTPTTREYHFPVSYNDVILVQVRCGNSLVNGQWGPEPYLKHTASDVPTHYLTGNLIPNSAFTVNPDWQPENYDSILKWHGVISTVGPLYLASVASTLDIGIHGAPASSDTSQSGFIYWLDVQNALLTWLMSDTVPVKENDRMVMYAYGWSHFTELRIDARFYNNQGNQIGSTMSETVNTYEAFPMINNNTGGLYYVPKSFNEFRLIVHFFKVPANAVTATMDLISYLKPTTVIPDGEIIMPVWFRPYFGRASVNQVQIPPWEKT